MELPAYLLVAVYTWATGAWNNNIKHQNETEKEKTFEITINKFAESLKRTCTCHNIGSREQ